MIIPNLKVKNIVTFVENTEKNMECQILLEYDHAMSHRLHRFIFTLVKKHCHVKKLPSNITLVYKNMYKNM